MIGRIVALAALVTTPAFGANRGGAALDNAAALSTSAIVATIRGGGATWYNPAGLGGGTRDKLDVSLSAFVLRDRSAADAVKGRLSPGLEASNDVESLEFVSIPTSLVFSRRLTDRVTLGLGVFVPELDLYRTATTTRIVEAPIDYLQRVEFSSVSQRYQGGAGVGWQISPRLRLGMALFATYETEAVSGQIWGDFNADIEDDPLRVTLLLDFDRLVKRIGAEVTGGVQWQIADDLDLGVTVRSPIVRLWSNGDGTLLVQSAAGGEQPEGGLDEDFGDDASGRVIQPYSVHGGLGWTSGDLTLLVAAEYRAALRDRDAGARYDAVMNAQFGGRLTLSETFVVGAGLFTDRAARARAEGLGTDRVDFYGITGGVRIRSPLRLVDEKADDIVFETVIGVRYALGVGQAGGLGLDFTRDELIQEIEVDVTHHTATLHIGSALIF